MRSFDFLNHIVVLLTYNLHNQETLKHSKYYCNHIKQILAQNYSYNRKYLKIIFLQTVIQMCWAHQHKRGKQDFHIKMLVVKLATYVLRSKFRAFLGLFNICQLLKHFFYVVIYLFRVTAFNIYKFTSFRFDMLFMINFAYSVFSTSRIQCCVIFLY